MWFNPWTQLCVSCVTLSSTFPVFILHHSLHSKSLVSRPPHLIDSTYWPIVKELYIDFTHLSGNTTALAQFPVTAWGWGGSAKRTSERVSARELEYLVAKLPPPQEFQFECHRQTQPPFLRPMTDHNSCYKVTKWKCVLRTWKSCFLVWPLISCKLIG